MLADSHFLKWRENGPGVGRDARIAYSGLLGRYMARAYLTVHEGVRELIPLDEAKRQWEGTAYCIRKHPRERGHEADWIGRDDRGHMVIAEAKGSFDTGVRTWAGPAYRPEVLQTAIDQAGRTAIFKNSRNTPLRAKRWAIASRWSNECNQRTPTLLAWDPDEGELERGDYRELAYHLRRADVEGVMAGLGHHQAARVLMAGDSLAPARGALRLRVGSRSLDHGYAALVGPVGIHPLRNPVTGKELDLDIVLDINPADLAEIDDGAKVDYDEVARALGVLVGAWKEMDVDRARTGAIDDAITFACTECGIREGDIPSDEQAAQFARAVSGRMTPYLVHTILASRLTEDDRRAIQHKLRGARTEPGTGQVDG